MNVAGGMSQESRCCIVVYLSLSSGDVTKHALKCSNGHG